MVSQNWTICQTNHYSLIEQLIILYCGDLNRGYSNYRSNQINTIKMAFGLLTFNDQPSFDHLNSRLVRNSEPKCFMIFMYVTWCFIFYRSFP